LTDSTVTLGHNVLAGAAGSGWGGGAVTSKDSILRLEQNTIRGNSVEGAGAGVLVQGGEAVITNNVFSGNSASLAGGAIESDDAAIVVLGNVVTGNRGTSTIACASGYGMIANNTIVENSGSPGAAAVATGENFTVGNNIIAFNGGMGLSSEAKDIRSNDVVANASGNYQGADRSGTDGNISADPLFVDRAGGDDRLTRESPCVDAGDDTMANQNSMDLDGTPRIRIRHVDIGAYEMPVPPLSLLDVASVMRMVGGLDTAARWDVENRDFWGVGGSSFQIDILDAAALARRLGGFYPDW
jgi:predicted outer membrane repeat protein